MLPLLLITTTWASPSAEELRLAWERWRPVMDQHAVYPVAWTEAEWARVAKGKVAKRRQRVDGADRVLGLVYVPANLDTTWLAVQDEHGASVPGMVNELLPGASFQHKLLYQSIKLPWPLAPRQWVVLVTNNQALIQATGGKVWERTWTLNNTRGAQHEQEEAVWLPLNDGGWYFVEAGEGTLLAYHVRSVVGGNVPDELATRWSFSTLSGMLTEVVDRVPTIPQHYVEGHVPMRRPDGTTVPFFPVKGAP